MNHSYSSKTPVTEPVEVRLAKRTGSVYVLLASVTDAGTVRYSLTPASGDTPLSLSTLQATGTYPRKAFPGWQVEAVAYAMTGLYEVVEVL